MIPWQSAVLGRIAFFYEGDGSLVCVAVSGLLKDKDYIDLWPAYHSITLNEMLGCFRSQDSRDKLQKIDETYIDNHPITFLEFGGRDRKLIDGNHRYIKAYELKYEMILARYVPKKLWQKYIIDSIDSRFRSCLDRTQIVAMPRRSG